MVITVVGGTFTVLHKGHRALLERAVQGSDLLIVGLTTDEFSSSTKKYRTVPYETRKKNLELFLEGLGQKFEIRPLEKREGTAVSDPSFQRLVVSAETYVSALAINEGRKKNGLTPLAIDTVPYILADDMFPVSSSRILSGEIDDDGKRLIPLRVAVATDNQLKKDAVASFFKEIAGNVEIISGTAYRTDKQPFGEDIPEMAARRSDVDMGSDYTVGIEAGLEYERKLGSYLDVHVCIVKDRYGNRTIGKSSSFQVPASLADLVKKGHDLSEAFSIEHGTEDIGSKSGVVGYYSSDRVTRRDLIIESLRNAFIPRISPTDYDLKFRQ